MFGAEIEEFYATHKGVYDFLLSNGQPTFASETNNNFRRSLLLAIASFFEHEIVQIVRQLPGVHCEGNPYISAMIEQKVIARQYHTYFDWDKNNANKFFKLFGSDFQERASRHVKGDAELDKSVQDFLELGNTRNRLVHLNYVSFDVDKSPEDIITLYRSALNFIKFLRHWLIEAAPSAAPASPHAPPSPTTASSLQPESRTVSPQADSAPTTTAAPPPPTLESAVHDDGVATPITSEQT